ncbi:hypothetical protein RRG08_024670 [Elysia crispata]|uniref:Uncharacterized protein n=1 Tax=Elysia crispata TaxID=231223 RepID=A0AAE0ZWN4_9GAST|nr:hypothetical protein RRG08_024670 [Elysia crispata]
MRPLLPHQIGPLLFPKNVIVILPNLVLYYSSLRMSFSYSQGWSFTLPQECHCHIRQTDILLFPKRVILALPRLVLCSSPRMSLSHSSDWYSKSLTRLSFSSHTLPLPASDPSCGPCSPHRRPPLATNNPSIIHSLW